MKSLLSFIDRISIESVIYYSAMMIALSGGLTGSVLKQYFNSHVTPQFLTNVALLGIVIEWTMARVGRSKIAIRYFSQNFSIISVLVQIGYFIIACFGEEHVWFRFIAHTTLSGVGICSIKLVRKNNFNCLYQGEEITTFNCKVDQGASFGQLVGVCCLALILTVIDISPTTAMFAQFIVISVGMALEAYANRKIQKELKLSQEKIKIADVLKDVYAIK